MMRALARWILPIMIAAGTAAGTMPAQQDPVRIQRDQGEVLRKAERLRGLMESLLARYEKEGDAEKVRLLRLGLQHLRDSGLMQDVASVRNSLDSGAVAEAVRKQNEVVADLEQLLAILLERPTAEALQEEIARTAELAQQAAELAKRQGELQREVDEAVRGEASDAERATKEQLGQLAREVRREANDNERQAGVRRPMLEAAMDRVRKLLEDQGRLEERVRDESGAARSGTRDRAFQLGALKEGQEGVQAAQARQAELEELAQQAAELRGALAAKDDARTRQQRDRTQAALQSAARGTPEQAETERRELESLGEQLQAAPMPDGTGEQADQARRELDDVARRIEERARGLAARTGERAAQQQADLAKQAGELAAESKGDSARPDASAEALQKAAEAMQRAAEAAQAGDESRARREAAQATRLASEARQAFQAQNPDAESQARRMADEAERTSRALRAAAPQQPDAAENRAAESLEGAKEALRHVADKAGEAAQSGEPAQTQAVDQALQTSRESLEQALEGLKAELQDSNAGREKALDAARERNRQLGERAQGLQQATQKAATEGQLSEAQASAASEAMRDAQQAMQSADQSLQQGEQSQAANQQQRAADSLDRAAREMAQNRPVTDEQRDALKDVAERQKELQDDIMRLAELMEQRENRRAQDALSRAQKAAEQAEQSLKRGDADEAREQQQEAKQQLEQAQKELEQERDRYQDLRQEELLFKIEEELKQFLETQRPITVETAKAGEELRDGGRMSRPMRRNLNRLGESERELAGKVRYVREALAEEGTLVFTHVLESNERDLTDVSERLGSREPDAGEFTVLLQRDVEERTEKLLAALERERQRRREERQQQQQQQDQQQQDRQNQFGPQRQRLVPIIAELVMLKQMEEEMNQRTRELDRLIQAVGADGISEVEAAMAQRLAHQHNALTGIFEQLKAQLQQALGQQGEDAPQGGEGRGGGR